MVWGRALVGRRHPCGGTVIGVWWLLQAQAEEPTAMEQRMSIAQALATDSKTVEEARDILIGLLAVPELHDEALKTLLISWKPNLHV